MLLLFIFVTKANFIPISMKVADCFEIFVIWRSARNHGHGKGVPCQHSPPRLLYRDQEIFAKEKIMGRSL